MPLCPRRLSARRTRLRRSFDNLCAALRSEHGVVDLASIMVGVIVTGIMVGAATVSVFVVVPYAQDRSAQSGLDSVRASEMSASARTGKYLSMASMVEQGQAITSLTLKAGVGLNGGCFVASSKSATGTTFYTTSQDESVLSNRAGAVDTSWCVTLP